MALTKKEKKEAEEIQQLIPKKEVADVKDLSDFVWNSDLFNREKNYKTSLGDGAVFKQVRAPWRKFYINNINIVAIEGERVTKRELAAFDGLSKETKEKYFSKVAKKKSKKETAAE